MSEESAKAKEKPASDVDKYMEKLWSAFSIDDSTRTTVDQTLRTLMDLLQRVPEQFAAAFKTMVEFLQQLTNVKGVKVDLKNFKTLDVQIDTMKEGDVPLNKDLGAMGKVESLHIGRKLHMAAEIGEMNKDYLRLHVYQGMKLVVVVPLLGKQQIDLKGSTRLAHDEKKQLALICTAFLPGTELPVTVTVPFSQVIEEIKKLVK